MMLAGKWNRRKRRAITKRCARNHRALINSRILYSKLNSMNTSALENHDVIHAAQYLRLMVARACAWSCAGNSRAVAAVSGPVTTPRTLHGATETEPLFRILLYFPEIDRVIT